MAPIDIGDNIKCVTVQQIVKRWTRVYLENMLSFLFEWHVPVDKHHYEPDGFLLDRLRKLQIQNDAIASVILSLFDPSSAYSDMWHVFALLYGDGSNAMYVFELFRLLVTNPIAYGHMHEGCSSDKRLKRILRMD